MMEVARQAGHDKVATGLMWQAECGKALQDLIRHGR